MNIKKIFLSFFLFISFVLNAQTYLVNQNFEGTGYDNSETWSENLGPDPDYTTTVLRGNQSLYLEASNYAQSSKTFTAQDSIWAFCQFQLSSLSGTNIDEILDIRKNSPSADLIHLRYYHVTDRFILYVGTTAGTAIATVIPAINTTYYLWLKYVKGTGANARGYVYISTIPIRPSTPTATVTNGNATGQADKILLSAWATGNNYIYDQAIVLPGNEGEYLADMTDYPEETDQHGYKKTGGYSKMRGF